MTSTSSAQAQERPSSMPGGSCYTITNGSDFRVLNGGLVTWRARDLLTLRNGFEVHAGGTFEAELDPDAGSFTEVP
jgi:hypothetical protein